MVSAFKALPNPCQNGVVVSEWQFENDYMFVSFNPLCQGGAQCYLLLGAIDTGNDYPGNARLRHFASFGLSFE